MDVPKKINELKQLIFCIPFPVEAFIFNPVSLVWSAFLHINVTTSMSIIHVNINIFYYATGQVRVVYLTSMLSWCCNSNITYRSNIESEIETKLEISFSVSHQY